MFAEALTWTVDQLHAAGINAAIDPADVNTPGVWIVPATGERTTLDDQSAEVSLTLYLVAGSMPIPHALDALDALAANVHKVIRLRRLDAVQVALPNHNPAGLPAYRTTITLDIKE